MRTIVLVISLAMFLVCTCMAETFQGVDFSIIKKTNQANIKGSIEVRLNEKVPKDLLQKLALKLKNDDPQKYDRLFITYYLPGMTSGAGAWATSHFNPGLEVKILGTTIEEEKELKKQTASSSDKVIGEWLDESPYVGAKYTLLKKGNQIIMIRKFKDKSGSEKEMTQKKHGELLRFEEKGGNSNGEYYLIEKNGHLCSYDSEGLIKSIKSIK